MANITFANRLLDSDWDDALRAWRCPVLNIPGASVRDIVVDGTRIDKALYEVLLDQAMIHWVTGDRPPRIAVIIELTKSLSLGSETDRWKRLAIVLPVVATIAAASISATGTYYSSRLKTGAAQVTESTASATPKTQPSESKVSEDTEINLSMPRGDKICVGWKGQDQEQSYTDVFKRSGISVVDFHQAIKIAYGALTNKRPDGFDFIPFMANNKILGGCEAITNAGPSQGSKFTEFQLFQNGFEFTILFHPLTDKLPTIAPDKIGVDWDKVRSGFRAALRTLYKDRDFEFGAVNVLTGEDGGWEYRLSYHKI